MSDEVIININGKYIHRLNKAVTVSFKCDVLEVKDPVLKASLENLPATERLF